jgi:hypothetical protein
MELRLIPLPNAIPTTIPNPEKGSSPPPSPSPIDVTQQGLSIHVDACRPLNVSSELLALAWLDPRVRYDAEIVLKDKRPGKAIHIHGLAFKKYIRDVESLPADWREDYNERNGFGGRKWYTDTDHRGLLLVSQLRAWRCDTGARVDG